MNFKIFHSLPQDMLRMLLFLLCATMLTWPAWGTSPAGHHDDDDAHDHGFGIEHGLLRRMTLCAADRSQLLGIAHSCAEDLVALRGKTRTLQEALTSLLQQRPHELGALGEHLAQMRALAEDLQGEHLSLDQEYTDLLRDNARVHEAYAELEDDFLHLQARHDSLRGVHRSMLQRHQQMVKDRLGLAEHHAGQGRDLRALRQKHTHLLQHHHGLAEEHAALDKNHTALQQKHQKLLQEHGELRSVHERSGKTLEVALKENGRLSSLLAKKQCEIVSLYGERARAKVTMEDYFNKSKDAWLNVQKGLQEQEEKRRMEYVNSKLTLEREKTELRKELEDMKEAYNNIQRVKEDQKDIYESMIQTHKLEKMKLGKDNDEKVNDLLREKERVLEDVRGLLKNNSDLEQERDGLEQFWASRLGECQRQGKAAEAQAAEQVLVVLEEKEAARNELRKIEHVTKTGWEKEETENYYTKALHMCLNENKDGNKTQEEGAEQQRLKDVDNTETQDEEEEVEHSEIIELNEYRTEWTDDEETVQEKDTSEIIYYRTERTEDEKTVQEAEDDLEISDIMELIEYYETKWTDDEETVQEEEDDLEISDIMELIEYYETEWTDEKETVQEEEDDLEISNIMELIEYYETEWTDEKETVQEEDNWEVRETKDITENIPERATDAEETVQEKREAELDSLWEEELTKTEQFWQHRWQELDEGK